MHVGGKFREPYQFPGCGITADMKFVHRLKIIQGYVRQILAELLVAADDEELKKDLTAVIALSICMLSTLAPSWWAARMLPVEGLRHE